MEQDNLLDEIRSNKLQLSYCSHVLFSVFYQPGVYLSEIQRLIK